MTHKEIIRKFFEPFQNLNLLTLIGNLRSGIVVRHDWYERRARTVTLMCPLSHGLQKKSAKELCIDDSKPDFAIKMFGEGYELFTECWDTGEINNV